MAAPDAGTRDSRSILGSTCTPVWRTSPSPPVGQGTLNALSVVSPRDIWAVGGVVRLNDAGEIVSGAPLIEHWNGTRWSVVRGPSSSGVLTDVAATSRRDGWAVGFVPGARDPLVLHWDGRQWSHVALPADIRATDAVSALSSHDVWIAGTHESGYRDTGEVAHWNGRVWTRVVARPNAMLAEIEAVSARDVWAVGATPTDDLGKALMLHWDGSRWQATVRGPTSWNDDAWLLAVGAGSGRDVWVGGGEHEAEMSTPAIGPLMLHWNGKRWSYARLPGFGATEVVGLAVISPREAWAVSSSLWSYAEEPSFGTWHLTGGRWNAAELPRGWELYDVDAARGSRGSVVWAVGQIGTHIVDYATRTVPLIRRFGC